MLHNSEIDMLHKNKFNNLKSSCVVTESDSNFLLKTVALFVKLNPLEVMKNCLAFTEMQSLFLLRKSVTQ
jgi:hypothetical protein